MKCSNDCNQGRACTCVYRASVTPEMSGLATVFLAVLLIALSIFVGTAMAWLL